MDKRTMYQRVMIATLAALCLSACGKDGKPGDAQPVPRAEAPIPAPTPVTAPSVPDTAPDPGKGAPAIPAPQASGTTEAK